MGDATTEHTVLSHDQARIDGTLSGYFNFSTGNAGLQSNHGRPSRPRSTRRTAPCEC